MILQKTLIKYSYWLMLLMPISICIEVIILGEINLILIGLIGAVYAFTDKNKLFLQEKWLQGFIVLLAYLCARSLFAEETIVSIKRVIPLIRFVFFLIAAQYLCSNKNTMYLSIYKFTSIALLFLILDGYIQYFTGRDILFGRELANENYYFRITGPYLKKVFGVVVSILSTPIFAVFIYYFKTRNYIKTILFGAFSLLVFVVILLTGERTPLLQIIFSSLILLSIYILSLNKTKKAVTALVVISILISCSALIMMLYPTVLERQIISTMEIAKNFSASVYGQLWISGLKIGMNNILFGIGGNHFARHCRELGDGFCANHPHSIYIEFFSEFGIIGLILLLYLLYCFLSKICKFYLSETGDSFRKFLILGIGISVLQTLLPLPSSTFSRSWFGISLFFMLGWALCLMESAKDKKHR